MLKPSGGILASGDALVIVFQALAIGAITLHLVVLRPKRAEVRLVRCARGILVELVRSNPRDPATRQTVEWLWEVCDGIAGRPREAAEKILQAPPPPGDSWPLAGELLTLEERAREYLQESRVFHRGPRMAPASEDLARNQEWIHRIDLDLAADQNAGAESVSPAPEPEVVPIPQNSAYNGSARPLFEPSVGLPHQP